MQEPHEPQHGLRTRKARAASWVLALAVVAIYGLCAWGKLTASPKAVWVFTQLGAEPTGRILTALLEVAAAMLILVPPSRLYGAILSLALMGGALMTHLFVIGIVVEGDGGLAFGYAVFVTAASAQLFWLHRGAFPVIGPMIGPES